MYGGPAHQGPHQGGWHYGGRSAINVHMMTAGGRLRYFSCTACVGGVFIMLMGTSLTVTGSRVESGHFSNSGSPFGIIGPVLLGVGGLLLIGGLVGCCKAATSPSSFNSNGANGQTAHNTAVGAHGQAYNGPGQGFNVPGQGFSGPGQGFSGPGQGFNGPGQGFNGPGQGFNGPGQGFSAPGQGYSYSGQTSNTGWTGGM